MRKIALVAAMALIPLIPAAPAHASAHVICVQNPTATCDESKPTIPEAIDAASLNGQSNTILVGPGTYTDGPYTLDGSSSGLTLKGAGQGQTFISLPEGASQTYVNTYKATIEDVTITMNPLTSSNDHGLSLFQANADHVTVDGAGTANSTGMTMAGSIVSDVTVAMPVSDPDSTGVFADSGSTMTDSIITGAVAFDHSGLGVDVLSRLSIQASSRGIVTDGGDVDVDDTLIDLGNADNAAGLAAVNFNNSTSAKSIDADHVTIVGGGTASKGVWAYASTPGALQQAAVTMTNSIVRGPQVDLQAEAGNNGSQGGTSTAIITTSYSDWSTKVETSGANGTAQVAGGTGDLLDKDPLFVDATGGDYRLSGSSPLIDKGAPGTGAPTLDLANGARILDGNADGLAVRDMGAYEAPTKVLPDTTAPGTTITAHPHKRLTKRRATFRFTSNEANVTFQCKLDRNPWRSCTSPKTYRVTLGWHRFRVRARDAAGNVDATPAAFRFHRV